MRLEKLLSRDERFLREYPRSLADIAHAYVQDMEAEGQYAAHDDATVKAARSAVFPWIKSVIAGMGYAA